MKVPKISIIVPVYNVEKYLSRCIDSILAQTFTDFELLLIDDGSKDKSGEICDEYVKKDDRVRAFHKENGGASAARNVGLDKATGEYISFIDSDDWIGPDYYKDYFGNEDFKYDIIFQNYICHNQDGTMELKELKDCSIKNGSVDEVVFYLLKEFKFGWTWIKLFKHSIISKYNIRFEENIPLHEDELFSLQYCRHIKSLCIRNKANYHYYIYSSSLTRSFRDPIKYIQISTLLKNELLNFKANGIIEYIEIRYLKNLFGAVLCMYMHGKLDDYDKSRRYFVIRTFLFYNLLYKEIRINYKSFRARCMYSLLWFTKSPKIIDLVMQKWFSVNYN